MWGSYVGALLPLIVVVIQALNAGGTLTDLLSDLSWMNAGYSLGGFIGGWAVHSLFRKFRK